MPDANLGIRTGIESGIVVIDPDRRGGGDISLERLESVHGPLPETPMVLTPGGRHYYFAHPGDVVKNDNKGLVGAGIDVKADGGYVVAPPSVGREQRRYEWEVSSHPDDLPLTPLPDWIIKALQMSTDDTDDIPQEKDNVSFICKSSVSSVSPATHRELIMRTLPNAEGERNTRLFWLARKLKGIYPDLPASALRPVIEVWHRHALPNITTKDFATTWAGFTYAWEKGRIVKPADPNLLPDVLDAAKSGYPCEAERYDSPKVRLLVSICAELQRRSTTGEIFLACRDAAKMIGTDHVTASKFIRMLAADGLLIEMRRATTFQATRYRYTGGKVR